MTAERRAERAEPRGASPGRTAALMLVLSATLVAAIVSWIQVVSALRHVIPLETRGTPAAIVWSDRVFRSEAEFARWLRGRGISYERWVRTHPRAVAILRKRDRAAVAAPAVPARTAAATSAQRSSRPKPAADDEALSGWWAALAVCVLLATTLAFLVALGASIRDARRRRAA
jgi:hypothetical protein